MKKIIIYIVLCFYSFPIIAQTERELTVSEIRQQTVLTEPLTLQKGYFKASSQFNYSVLSTSYYNNNWEKITNYGYMFNSFSIPFSINYGINDNLEINISSDYKYNKVSYSYKSINYIETEKSKEVKQNTIENGLNDISFGFNYNLISDKRTTSPSMCLAGYFTIPSGKSEPTSIDSGKTIRGATSFGCYELGVGYLIKKVFYPFSVKGILRYSYSFPTDLKLKYDDTIKTHIKYGDWLNCNITLNYMVCDWISFGNTLSYTYNGASEYNSVKDNIINEYYNWTPSLIFQIKNMRLSQGVSFYIIGKNAPSNPYAFIALAIKI